MSTTLIVADNYIDWSELLINIISFLFLANAGYFFAPAFASLWKTGAHRRQLH